jgi:hypothetical protein
MTLSFILSVSLTAYLLSDAVIDWKTKRASKRITELETEVKLLKSCQL